MLFEIETDPVGLLFCLTRRNKAGRTRRHLLEPSSGHSYKTSKLDRDPGLLYYQT